jgi:phenylpyruvate tautomerase PptA (4-oxalocrotonate tautomerase family)
MPHLQFELNFAPTAEEKRAFAREVVRLFSEIMDTGTDHVAVTLRTLAPDDLTFGRAGPTGARTAFVDADLRDGRTREQKRRLALAYVDALASRFGIAREAIYVILTEHDGHHFQLSDRVLPSWSTGEDPLRDPIAPASTERPARRRGARSPATKRPSRRRPRRG